MMKKQWSYLLINCILSLSLMTTYAVSYATMLKTFYGSGDWGLLYAAFALIAVYLFVWIPVLSIRYARRVADFNNDKFIYLGLNAIVLALPGFVFVNLPIFFIVVCMESFLIEMLCIKMTKRKSAGVQPYVTSESNKPCVKVWLQWVYPIIWILIIAALFAAWYSMRHLLAGNSYYTVRWFVTLATLTLYVFAIVPIASYRYGIIVRFKDKGKWVCGIYNGLLISFSYVSFIAYGALLQIPAGYAIDITLGAVFFAIWSAAWFLAPIINSKAIEDNTSEISSANAEMS